MITKADPVTIPGAVTLPVTFKSPSTSSFAAGLVVPMPTVISEHHFVSIIDTKPDPTGAGFLIY